MNGQDDVEKVWAVATKDDASTFQPNAPTDAQKDLFVWGNGSVGPGFYSQETRDAYEIILVKMKEKAAYRQSQVSHYDSDGLGCFSHCLPLKESNPPGRKIAVEQLEYATHLVALVRARLEATGPFVSLKDHGIAKHKGDPSSVGNSYTFQDLCTLCATKKTKRYKAYVWVILSFEKRPFQFQLAQRLLSHSDIRAANPVFGASLGMAACI